MIIIMALKDTQRELRTILAELKVQAKRFPSFGIMRTRSRGREIYCKIDYSSGKRKRTIIDHEGVEYRNLLRGLCISAKMDLYEFGGIVPWDNLITTFDKDGNIDLDYVKAIAGTILAA